MATDWYFILDDGVVGPRLRIYRRYLTHIGPSWPCCRCGWLAAGFSLAYLHMTRTFSVEEGTESAVGKAFFDGVDNLLKC